MKEIKLKFEKDKTRLTGFLHGQTTYNEQVKKEITENDIKIIFPCQVEKVASSFVQGFFAQLINTIGYEEIEKRFTIETATEKLTGTFIHHFLHHFFAF